MQFTTAATATILQPYTGQPALELESFVDATFYCLHALATSAFGLG